PMGVSSSLAGLPPAAVTAARGFVGGPRRLRTLRQRSPASPIASTTNRPLDVTTTLGPAGRCSSVYRDSRCPARRRPRLSPRRLATPPRSVSAQAGPWSTPSRREPRSPQRGSSHVVSGLSIENLNAARTYAVHSRGNAARWHNEAHGAGLPASRVRDRERLPAAPQVDPRCVVCLRCAREL